MGGGGMRSLVMSRFMRCSHVMGCLRVCYLVMRRLSVDSFMVCCLRMGNLGMRSFVMCHFWACTFAGARLRVVHPRDARPRVVQPRWF